MVVSVVDAAVARDGCYIVQQLVFSGFSADGSGCSDVLYDIPWFNCPVSVWVQLAALHAQCRQVGACKAKRADNFSWH